MMQEHLNARWTLLHERQGVPLTRACSRCPCGRSRRTATTGHGCLTIIPQQCILSVIMVTRDYRNVSHYLRSTETFIYDKQRRWLSIFCYLVWCSQCVLRSYRKACSVPKLHWIHACVSRPMVGYQSTSVSSCTDRRVLE